ncbi:GNAT family N-acetyltransferase [Frigoribacterium sp. 2-23]|uniref:GNAT family N-acetyltransferase n=1 Tax=Frigoribacterium sp. 2-23 TaxID=3415006 RepID=UPI003C6F5242
MPQTDRLRLRRWQDSDREPFAALNADLEVMRFFPSTRTPAESDAMIDRLDAGIAERGYGLWAVERRDTGAFIGFVGLSQPTFDPALADQVEIGWRLARGAWGQGFATEAAREVVRFAFDPDGADLDALISFTAAVNLPSRRVMERLGMTYDIADDFDHPALPEGHELRPHVLYRLRR